MMSTFRVSGKAPVHWDKKITAVLMWGCGCFFVVGTGVWYVSQNWDMYQTPVPTRIGRYIKKALNVIKPDIQS